MELEGTFHDGVIVPDDTESMAEGARFRLVPVEESKPHTFGERYADFRGAIPDLPEDLARQHEHYRLGTPKR